MTRVRTLRSLVVAGMAAAALTLAGCSEDDSLMDDAEQNVDDAEQEVDEGLDDLKEELDEGVDEIEEELDQAEDG